MSQRSACHDWSQPGVKRLDRPDPAVALAGCAATGGAPPRALFQRTSTIVLLAFATPSTATLT